MRMSPLSHWRETFIFREVSAVNRAVGTKLPIFSPKPRVHDRLDEPWRQLLRATYYPSRRTAIPAVPTVFTSPRARACVRQVIAAYQTRPLGMMAAASTSVTRALVLSGPCCCCCSSGF